MLRTLFASLYVCLAIVSATDALASSCAQVLPAELKKYFEAHYPLWKIVETTDLVADDQAIWRQAHGDVCPGSVAGRFDEASDAIQYGVLLIARGKSDTYRLLVVADLTAEDFHPTTISRGKRENVPVISLGKPGNYRDVNGKRHRVRSDAIIFETLEAGAMAFYLSDKSWKSIRISE